MQTRLHYAPRRNQRITFVGIFDPLSHSCEPHVNNRAAYAARRPRLRFFGRSRAARQSVVAHPICARNPSRIEALQPNQHIIRR
jgi:hypothetical protein